MPTTPTSNAPLPVAAPVKPSNIEMFSRVAAGTRSTPAIPEQMIPKLSDQFDASNTKVLREDEIFRRLAVWEKKLEEWQKNKQSV